MRIRRTQAGEDAPEPRNDEGQHDRGACMCRRGEPSEHENARADDAADAERCERDGPQGAFQAVCAVVALQLSDGNRGEHAAFVHDTPMVGAATVL